MTLIRMLPVEPRQRFVRLLHRELQLDAFLEAADRALAAVVPFDSSCWLSLDPATLLPTSHFTRHVAADHLMELAANEYLEDDVNKFADLALADRPAATLSGTTGGDLQRSARFVRLLAPYGYGDGDELRATFLDGDAVWGCVALHRRNGTFEDREARLVADVGAYVAAGIRRAILRTALVSDAEPDPPGLIILRGDDSIESVTPAARPLLAEVFDSTLDGAVVPMTVMLVAQDARGAGAGRSDSAASVRLPRRSGGWLRVDASLLDGEPAGRVAVIVSAAREPEIASLIVEAYGLSAREREVTRLVLHGRSTQEIAETLHVSPYTVQDHLKSIFAKVGVRSRRELAARLFLQQCAPRLQAGAMPRSDGWFADDGAVGIAGASSIVRVG
ncbi:MAG TPA: LuxR C-terminal-related transcriptional regulator [Candidatus Limnocylindrales bacterium]